MGRAGDIGYDSILLRLKELEKENAMLKRILDEHGIPYLIPEEDKSIEQPTRTLQLSLQEKVALFQDLFRGRDDVGV